MWKLGKSQFRMKSNPSLKKERKKKRKKKGACTIISQIPVSDLHSIPHQSPN